MIAAKKALPSQAPFFFNVPHTSKAKYRKLMNKAPCIQPHILTASGKCSKYLRGIATSNKTKNETPSAIAMILKRCINFLFAGVFIK